METQYLLMQIKDLFKLNYQNKNWQKEEKNGRKEKPTFSQELFGDMLKQLVQH